MKTYAPKPRDIERRWYVIDASGAVLGRLASEVAAILKGKHKPIYAPHADTGDHVVVVNAGQVRLTGAKEEKKIAYRHSGYPGGLTETKYGRLMATRPAFAVEKAIRGMLPHNSLGRAMARKLHVHAGAEHPHTAQKPEALALGAIPKWDGLPVREPKAAPKPRAAKPAARRAAAERTTAKRTAAKPKGTTARKPATATRPVAKKADTPAKKPRARKAKEEDE